MHDTLARLQPADFPALRRGTVETLQLNLGYLCNQRCLHCHVNAGPKRNELMSRETIDLVLEYIRENRITTLDLTGGAPEMNPHFSYLVEQAVGMGVHVMDRCNLTILSEPGYEWLGQFLAVNRIEVVASLPCYLEDNVDAQRGEGVFARSIAGLQQLNALGYGVDGSENGNKLSLSLVYNPQGPSLPPAQRALEEAYRRELAARYGISFTRLFTIANMPINRFGSMLISSNRLDSYIDLLKASHSDDNLASVMCRSLISIDWRGYVYDCDFNQMLGLPLSESKQPVHLGELIKRNIEGMPIATLNHCYACTAGQGSSCGGALEGRE